MGTQEIIMYILMIIVIILIILLLLKFCSDNSGKSIYKPSTTQNKTTTTTRKTYTTETTTTIIPSTVIPEPTTESTRPIVTGNIPGNTTRKTRTTAPTKKPVNPTNPVNPVNPTNPVNPVNPTNPTTEPTTKAAVYTYTYTKPTSETYAVNIFKDGQILSGSVYIWDANNEFLSVGVVGPGKVVTITTAASVDLSTHPTLKFSFQNDSAKRYTMKYNG